MNRVLVAPDKFRGTASGPQAAAALSRGAQRAGWAADAQPLSDGGEGLLDAVGGEVMVTTVTGPLGQPVAAQWRLLEGGRAVIEMAQAAGLELAGGRSGNDPLAATTAGVGELVAEAWRHGARQIVVGCGGSATTDGGLGAVNAITEAGVTGIELIVATDVTIPFVLAAAMFGPQKGADPDQIPVLTARLAALAGDYKSRFGIDVSEVPGAGAAGGLAGGLVAVGGRITPGFAMVAELVHLDQRLGAAQAVITGEGRLDATSFVGKVVSGVLAMVAGRVPVCAIVGQADDGLELPPGLDVISLVERFGAQKARADTLDCLAEAAADWLSSR